MTTIKLTRSQQSALGCRAIDPTSILARVWFVEQSTFRFSPGDAQEVLSALIEEANCEDAFATHPHNKGTSCARGAAGAARALSSLADKVLATISAR